MTNDYILAEYLRISEEDRRKIPIGAAYGDSQSIEGQREVIEDFIAGRPELKNARRIEFVDDGYSGTNFERPAVKDMLEKVRAGAVHCIIVKDFSRFGRNYIDVGDYLEQIFPFLRVRFISVNDGFDSDRQDCSAGDVSVAFKNLCNDYYCKDLSRKIKAGLYTLRESGKFLSPLAPFGYRKSEADPYRLIVDEKAAGIVRQIFDLRLSGNGGADIARTLNAGNAPTPMVYRQENGSNRKWNTHTARNTWAGDMVRDILSDMRYTGAVVQGMYKSDVIGSNKGRKVPREQWHVTHGCHEAIISPEDFAQVQQIRESNRKPAAKRKNAGMNERHPLAGKVRCGGCGYVLARSGGKQPVYACRKQQFTDAHTCLSGHVKASVIDDVVIAALRKLFDVFATEQTRRKEYSDIRAAAAMSAMREIQTLQKQIAGVQNNKLALYNRYSDGEIDKNEYFRLRDENEAHLRELSEQTAALEYTNATTDAPATVSSIDTVNGLHFDGRLTSEIVDALVDSVIVHSAERIEVKWKFADMLVLTG